MGAGQSAVVNADQLHRQMSAKNKILITTTRRETHSRPQAPRPKTRYTGAELQQLVSTRRAERFAAMEARERDLQLTKSYDATSPRTVAACPPTPGHVRLQGTKR